MPTLHVVTTKEFLFRGQPERFSNGYNFQTGTNPLDAAFAESVAKAVREMERNFHSSAVKFVYLVAGELGQDALWSEELAGAGPVGLQPPEAMHPETVVMMESKRANRLYLRKFFHTRAHLGTDGDQLNATQISNINDHCDVLTDGSLPGGVKACFPDGSLANGPFVADPFLRTRQLKRRGRRPTPSG